MTTSINTIKLGIVNCYLIHSDDSFVLIDTGYAYQRELLEKALIEYGCTPGQLKLIVLTHGDADHVGNAAYLRDLYNTKVGIHKLDSLMIETGDDSKSRKTKPDHLSLLFKVIRKLDLLSKQSKMEPFKADLYLEEGQNLVEYGLEANIVYVPGHTNGSIGILTKDGDFFCGDLIYNLPGFGYIDDSVKHQESIERIKQLHPRMIYPGHGKAFQLRSLKR
ncbi:MAG: MBL fold metallo-hydrolase [Erysipelotrichaceae bacterium]|nr:MBL fold metallo-hydrolase [Erysipelotrichaceae bacterium]